MTTKMLVIYFIKNSFVLFLLAPFGTSSQILTWKKQKSDFCNILTVIENSKMDP